MTLMGMSEALVESLKAEGTSTVFGLVGSAFMDALDIFPDAGIRFVTVHHEQNAAHMADAYTRVTTKPGVCTAQNGPGVTNMVTGIAAAYLAHSPVIAITPSAASATVGTKGFQEVDQMAIFAPITKYQVRLDRPNRIAEYVRTAFRVALAERGPVQIDIPRDHFYAEVDVDILPPERYRQSQRGAGPDHALDRAAELLAEAKFPVIISGLGVIESSAAGEVRELAEHLTAAVATSYHHNDAFPADHQFYAGPIGYQGSKAAMRLLARADVILALGTRLSVFGTLPQYGIPYFTPGAKIIQVDIDPRQLGLTRPIEVGIIGDAKMAATGILNRLREKQGHQAPDSDRLAAIQEEKATWAAELDSLSSSNRTPMSPKRALRELTDALPDDAIVTTDVGNICSVANSFLRFKGPRQFLAPLTFGNCGFAYPAALGAKVASPRSPAVALVGDGAWGMSLAEVMTAVQEDLPVLAVVFNNGQWGAEKRNQIDYYSSRFIGVDLQNPDYGAVARSMGADGCRIETPSDVGPAVREALASGRPTVLDVIVDPEELAEPFRRDALKAPTRHLKSYGGQATPARG